MKNLFRFAMAVAVLFTASCAKEDISSSIGGGEVEVTFTANLADLGTRAYGEANNVDVVYLGIYDQKGNYLDDLTVDEGYPVDPINHTASIPVVLLKDKTYDLVFWAQDKDVSCYSMNWTNRKMSVSYTDAVSQDDTRDAFFLVDNDFVAGEVKNPEFRLYRPFAQLNAGLSADEVTKIRNNGVDVSKIKSEVVVKQVASTLNLSEEATDTAIDVDDFVDASFIIAAKPEEALKVSEVDYEYLSMNYLLVNKKQNVTAEYIFTDVDGTTYTRKYDNVPLQRNYRTNIVGNLLSSQYEFNVIIVPGFNEPANNYVTTIEDLQLILDNAKANEVTKVILGADMKGDVTVFQKANTDIIIDGNEKKYKFDGTIKIHNGSNYNNGTLTIQKVAFETSTAELNFVMPNDFGVKDDVTRRYSNNVTVKYCSFTATGAAEKTAVGVQAKSCKDLKVLYCTGNNLHSLVQAQSCGENVEVKDCKINGKNGVAFKQVRNAVVEDCTINAKAYGIRFDGNTDNYGIVVKNNKVTALQPLIVRKMTGANNTITLEPTNEFNTTETFQIVVTNGSDDEAYSYPTGTYTLTGHDGFNTYPIDTPEALQAAVTNPALPEVDIQGEEKIDMVGVGLEITRNVVLNMNNVELNAGSTASSYWYAIEAKGDYTTVINDANFTRAGVFASEGADVVFNSGVIYHKPERTSRYIFAANSGATITVNGGKFTNDRDKNSFFWADDATIYVKGGDFGGSASSKKVVETNGGEVIISGGTFNFDPTAWVAEGYEAQKKGSKWQVVKEGSSIVTTTSELQAAIATAEDGDIIALAVGTYEGTFNVRNNITIESAESNNKATIKGRVNIDSNGNGATFKNLKFDINDDSKVANVFSGAAYQYPAIVVIYAAATNFENCEFKTLRSANVTSINYGSHTAGCVLNVNNCSFVGDFYAIRSRTLFSITNSDFNIHTDATLAAVFTWGNANSGANSVVFTGNNNSSGYNTMGVMLSSTTFPYDNISYNVQGNTNFVAFKDSINPACSVTGSTFADGSETF